MAFRSPLLRSESSNVAIITGSSTSDSDFRHCAEKHRPAVAAHVGGHEVVDHPTDDQLVALAREFLLKRGRMSGGARPS